MELQADRSSWPRRALLFVAAIGFVAAGVNHFIHPATYVRIIPPAFPAPEALVAISGIAEIFGGVGLLVPRLKRAAGWGLMALLVAVFPSNIYMAIASDRFSDLGVPVWALWLRLPLQLVMIGWVWYVAIRRNEAV